MASRETTVDDPTAEPAHRGGSAGLRLVVVWHQDPRRIGAAAWAPWAGDGTSADLSRQEPRFDDGAPLDDHRISRSLLQILAVPGGAEIWPTREGLRFDVDGEPGVAGALVPTAVLRRGVRLGLGRGAVLHVQLGGPFQASPAPSLVGRSEALEQLGEALQRAARAEGSVLITGESGTGKELVAHALHALSPRAAQPFVAVNTAALSASLGPSQLFGHVRGAFTGADAPSPGFFGEAHRGTLLLDEIGACPNEVQAQLLRALESGEVQVVGGSTRKVDVRVIAATDADLARECLEGRFRAPLYHRLARWSLRIPPLRDRPVDIAVQAAHFFREGLAKRGRSWPARGPDDPPWLGRAFLEALLDGAWPGNTRELRAFVEQRLDRDLDQPTCAAPSLPEADRGDTTTGESEVMDLAEALARCDYRLSAAAAMLGIGRNTLKRRMEEANLRRPADMGAAEIEAAIQREGGARAAARALRVSEHGLRIRMTELGIRE